ncbi:hypothetical protein [Lactococcus protaetiae]|uniref:Uncharacterized protein n=1 Tax=Lactococcus protaetiae TaxID=2592653 RepID=A0A514Z843_9LACT|nr:hypothetical protein [Lactococcus protaetiae]QDK70745.1 hypothetical protein FLP15_05735 [Lactococcus protaetiae]
MKKTLIKEVDKFTPVILVLLFFMFGFVLNGRIASNNLKVKHRAQTESFVANRKISVSVDFEGAQFFHGMPLEPLRVPKDSDIVDSGDYLITTVVTLGNGSKVSGFWLKETHVKVEQPVYFKNINLKEIKNISFSKNKGTIYSPEILEIRKIAE